MGHHFLPVDRATPSLLPPSLQEWLPEHHLARFVVEVVDQLHLTPLERTYAGRGSKAYHPAMLLALLFYGYARGLFSSRKLEAATYDPQVAFRYICANTHPDHDTIATFRRRFLPELEQCFTAILMLASEMGFLKLGTVSLDGSKLEANASKHKALSWGHACKVEEERQQEVQALLEMAETTDQEEEQAPLDIPAELQRRDLRLKAIRAAKAQIEARSQERYEEEKAAYEANIEARRAQEAATGKKARGKAPKPPEAGPREKDQVNLTDPESRIMPVSGGGFEQAYTVEAAVDIETHLIVAQFCAQAPNDKQQVDPALSRLRALPEEVGKLEILLTDNGFFSEANVEATRKRGIEPLMALGREAHNVPLEERMKVPESPSEGASAPEEMAYRWPIDGLSVEDAGGACALRKAQEYSRAGLRSDGARAGLWPVYAAGLGEDLRRMDACDDGLQHPPAVSVEKRPQKAAARLLGGDERGRFAAALLHRWCAMIARRSHQLFPVGRLILKGA